MTAPVGVHPKQISRDGEGRHQLLMEYAAAAMPTTIATSRARYDIDRHASFFQQCAGMAFLMSARVKGGRSARPFPVCKSTNTYDYYIKWLCRLQVNTHVTRSGPQHLPGTLPEANQKRTGSVILKAKVILYKSDEGFRTCRTEPGHRLPAASTISCVDTVQVASHAPRQ